MITVFKRLKDYLWYLPKSRLHILVLDCSLVSGGELDELYDFLISPMGGAYCSGDQRDYISDCIGELVAMKSLPTGEFSGFDLRWSTGGDGMMRHIWEAKYSSFLSGEFDIAVITHDDRYQDEQWVAKELERMLEIDR